MYFVRTPLVSKLFYPNVIFDIKGKEKSIFITFDDGPEEEVTPLVLEILEKFDAKATFFCLGKKAKKHPELIAKIKSLGHTTGNHSYKHLKASMVSATEYYADIEKCDEIISSKLFRPPYGSITKKQIRYLKSKYNIILWSILPGDFDQSVTKEKCLSRSIKHTKGGSIIVFHDNLKSREKLLYVLPLYLEWFSKLGYTFEALNENMFRTRTKV